MNTSTNEKQLDVYDHADFCKENLAPQLKGIMKLCTEHKIPYFASFAVAADETGKVTYHNSILTPSALGLKIPGCEVVPLMHISEGGRAVPASEIAEIEFD